MGPEWVSILALVALFVIGTVLPINMGALAYVAAWLVGMYALDLDEKEILAGVSGDLILTLIGVTYLFAIAKNNGTVDLIVRSAVKAVGGRVALIPWVMFSVTALLTAIGAASPAACAIIGPIALGFAGRYRINPLMMGMMVVHGAQAGGFSPISIYGTITNSVMEDADLPTSEIAIFLASLVVNLVLAAILFFALGGRKLMNRRLDPDDPDTLVRGPAPRRRHDPGARAPAPRPRPRPRALGVRRDQVLTLVAFVGVALIALAFDKNIGFVAITAAVILAMLSPNEHKDAVKQIAWPTVLLVAGVSTYATILTTAKAPEFVGDWAAGLGAVGHRRADPLLRRRRGLGVRLLDRAAAGDHPDRGAADRRRRHQRRPVRGRAGGLLDDRRRQPVLHQRRADAGQQAGHDRGAGLLQADPHLQRDRRPWSDRSSSGQPSCCRAGDRVIERADRSTDVLVVDLSRALAGPHATMMLGDLGARVIKVEAPGHGDDTRGWGPPFVGSGGRPAVDVLPLGQPQQGVDHPRPQGRGRQGRAAGSWSTGPTCWSRTSGPACSSGSGSASRRCTSATRGWWCCRSPASGTTAPRAAAPATTRSPRARPG